MMKKLMSFALAFTFVFVGANAADAAPDNPSGHDEFTTSEDCAACHNPETAKSSPSMDGIHEVGAHGDMSCGACHTSDNPETAYNESAPKADGSPVNCNGCHTSVGKAGGTVKSDPDGTPNSGDETYYSGREGWNIVYLEDEDTSSNISGKDSDGDGQPDGHHLEEDGTQKDCGACHANQDYATPTGIDVTTKEESVTLTFEELGYEDADPTHEHGVEIAASEGVTITEVNQDGTPWEDPAVSGNKVEAGLCFLATVDATGSTLFVDNVNSTITYTPGTDVAVGTAESFMISSNLLTNGNKQYTEITFTTVEAQDNTGDGGDNTGDGGDNTGDGGDNTGDGGDNTGDGGDNGGSTEPPTQVEDPADDSTKDDSTNPETGGTAGLMLSAGITAVAGAGLVVFRKRQ